MSTLFDTLPPTRPRHEISKKINEEAELDNHRSECIDPLLEEWVHALCRDAFRGFLILFKAHWPDEDDEELAQRDFENYVQSWRMGTRLKIAPARSPNWPWPGTDVEPGHNVLHADFAHDQSALYRFGYRVGKTHGKPQGERRAILSAFFAHELPREVATAYDGEYGAPRSEERLRKMAHVIAANCRNRKRHDAERFCDAIADWDADLAFLKTTFYDDYYSFDWPGTT